MKLILQNGQPLGLVDDNYDTSILYSTCEVIFVADNTDIRNNQDPRLAMSLEELRACHLLTVKKKSYQYITKYMEEWRQISWKEYVNIHKKVLGGQELDELEQALYANFPEGAETNDSAFADCMTAFGWIMQCVGASNTVEAAIKNATTKEELMPLTTVVYPPWPL